MVNQVFPAAQFTDQVRKFAVAIAKGPTAALGWAKKLLTLSAQSSLETQMEHERRAIAACGRTADFREGADAFFARGHQNFRGTKLPQVSPGRIPVRGIEGPSD